jgi:hypothetical protein
MDERTVGEVACEAHTSTVEAPQHDSGRAGGRARREHERRKARREQAVRDKHARFAGLLLALREPPHHERRFVQGDLPLLGTLSISGFPLLHRRSLPKRLNADGPLTTDRVVALTEGLALRLPPA